MNQNIINLSTHLWVYHPNPQATPAKEAHLKTIGGTSQTTIDHRERTKLNRTPISLVLECSGCRIVCNLWTVCKHEVACGDICVYVNNAYTNYIIHCNLLIFAWPRASPRIWKLGVLLILSKLPARKLSKHPTRPPSHPPRPVGRNDHALLDTLTCLNVTCAIMCPRFFKFQDSRVCGRNLKVRLGLPPAKHSLLNFPCVLGFPLELCTGVFGKNCTKRRVLGPLRS